MHKNGHKLMWKLHYQ